jgi:hypothetical protein
VQIGSSLNTVAAGAGLLPAEMAARMIKADRPEKGPLYETARVLLEEFRHTCLQAGVLDYGLAIHLFVNVLMTDAGYLDHLRSRFRYLLVDDLDETVPAEHDFIAAVASTMAQVVYAFNTDGGHSGFMGADPTSALQRFRPTAEVVALTGSHTCSLEAYRFADALSLRIMGQRTDERAGEIVAAQITSELRGEMMTLVAETVQRLITAGTPPGEIAVITPHVEKALEVTLHRSLAGLAPVQNLSLSRRLVDDPHARAIITLAGLVHPHWNIPRDSAGFITNAVQLLLKLDPIRAAILGDAIWRKGELPDLDEVGLRRRIGFRQAESYEYLRQWVEQAKAREWPTDTFAQAVVAELFAPLMGDLQVETLHSCQQLLLSAYRFRTAMQRFGDGAYGSAYIKMLTEGTVAAEPLEAYDASEKAVLLTTPFAYLGSRRTSTYQVWVDLSGSGWYPNDVKELANPHVLSRRWEDGERWSDTRNNRIRQANAARTVRALLRRLTGRLILADCSLTPWGYEQEGGLSEAFAELSGI